MPRNQAFGVFVRDRIIQGRPVRELADQADLNRSQLYEILRGHVPKPESLRRLADAWELDEELRAGFFEAAGVRDAPQLTREEELAQSVAERVAQRVMARFEEMEAARVFLVGMIALGERYPEYRIKLEWLGRTTIPNSVAEAESMLGDMERMLEAP